MMPVPPDAPLTVRLGARVGPEAIAAILVVAVVVVGLGLALAARSGFGGGTPAASPSAPAVAATGSPGAASPSAEPPKAPARALVEIFDRLLVQRAALDAEAAKSRTDAVAIASLLQDVNASLLLQDSLLADLAADPGTRDLATRIRAMNAATFEATRRTQRASFTNTKAYRSGAAEVVQALDPLPGLRAELARIAGGSPAPAAPVQSGATATPSGANP